MKSILFLFFFLICSYQADAQGKSGPDSLYYKVYMLDSIWTTGTTKKTALKDSLSYFEIRGSKVEICLKTSTSETREKGRVIYWKESMGENGLMNNSFYISGRGAFKGSLTVTIKQIDQQSFEIHMLNAFATFDKKIQARIGEESEIIRPPKKQYKPGSK